MYWLSPLLYLYTYSYMYMIYNMLYLFHHKKLHIYWEYLYIAKGVGPRNIYLKSVIFIKKLLFLPKKEPYYMLILQKIYHQYIYRHMFTLFTFFQIIYNILGWKKHFYTKLHHFLIFFKSCNSVHLIIF
jgi:hypothetical protein